VSGLRFVRERGAVPVAGVPTDGSLADPGALDRPGTGAVERE
jgi:hypothetical protein